MISPTLSILITAYHEPNTIGRAIEAIQPQLGDPPAEIIVVCPDDETANAASVYDDVTVLRDAGQGKPAALNLGLEKAAGQIVVMTDGDVFIDPGALKALLAPFDDPKTGAVSSRPVSLSPRDTMLGYWSHLLTDAGAHTERLLRDQRGAFMVCSGYLYAIRSGLVDHIPEDALAEDAVVSHLIGERGYRVRYAPEAIVSVKYPTTYRDWLMQRVRSAGGYVQPVIAQSPLHMRSFWYEAIAGPGRALAYARNPRELAWTFLLMLARLHLWLLIFWRVKLQAKPLLELWQRVESTK